MMSRIILLISAFLVPVAFQGCNQGTPVSHDDTEYSEPVVVEQVEEAVDVEPDGFVEDVPLLTVGDTAPTLDIEKWVKGTSVDGFDSNKVYVVEFWATWCGPCRTSMPHLSELQQEHEDDIVVVGISNEDEEVVTKFLDSERESDQTWNDVIHYNIAIDRDDATTSAYLKGARARGIPTAFVVGQDGKIDWIGHPMALDSVLPQVTAGNWDRELARTEREAEMAREALEMELAQLVMTARAEKNFDGAIAALDAALAKYPGDHNFLASRFRLLVDADRLPDATQLVADIDASNTENLDLLNFLAWTSTSTDDTPLMEASLRAIEQAYEASDSEDANVIDTIARVYYKLGNVEQAIAMQEKAVALSSEESLKESLEEYREALAGPQTDEVAPDVEEQTTVTSEESADEPGTSE